MVEDEDDALGCADDCARDLDEMARRLAFWRRLHGKLTGWRMGR